MLIKLKIKNKPQCFPFQSTILTESQSIDLIKLCEFDSKSKFTLLYRASRDGFGAQEFHSKCDNISKTLAIIKAKDSGNVFGGYTEATWDQIRPNPHQKEDENAFNANNG